MANSGLKKEMFMLANDDENINPISLELMVVLK
jgi:hypothetical protein